MRKKQNKTKQNKTKEEELVNKRTTTEFSESTETKNKEKKKGRALLFGIARRK